MASFTLYSSMCLLVGSYYVFSHIALASGNYSYGGKPHKQPSYTKPPSQKQPPRKPSYQKPPRNHNNYGNAWLPATATWYGSATGAGSDGGACGYGSLAKSPYGSRVSAGSPVLFKSGMGCGACYQVKCLAGGICSTRPVTVVITDECPGGYCAFGRTHFDMSGSAFSGMASSIRTTQNLLNAGVVQVLYKRVPCFYPRGTTLAFQVNDGATNYWFSMLVRYEGGDGDLSAVQLMEKGQWKQMEHLWGAYWCLNAGPLSPPFSIRITSSSGSSLTAYNVIPANWVPGQTYSSRVNF
eukprot:c23526_g2_i1 orf=632-1519(-)